MLSELLTNVHYWFAVYALGGLFLIYRYKWQGVRMVIAALLLIALTDSLGHYVLKPLVNRQRPCALIAGGAHVVSWIRLPTGMKWDESFPSSHALNNFAVATFFSLIFRRKSVSIPLFLIATLVSLGRVYEGVHYPSDVLGGAVIGALVGFATAQIFLIINRSLARTNS
jgi:undecaprenyl-diphosphatase